MFVYMFCFIVVFHFHEIFIFVYFFSGGQRQVISWMDAPDDVYYKATANTKKLRKRLPVVQLRRAARKPFKKVITIP